MEDATIIKLTKRVLIEDIKKPELTSKERADLIFSYKKASGKTMEELSREMSISPSRISQYCCYARAVDEHDCKAENISQFLKDGKFSTYAWISQGYTYLSRMKVCPPLTPDQRRKCKILSAKLELWGCNKEI